MKMSCFIDIKCSKLFISLSYKKRPFKVGRFSYLYKSLLQVIIFIQNGREYNLPYVCQLAFEKAAVLEQIR